MPHSTLRQKPLHQFSSAFGLKPKPKRLEKRKRVTLIAAFRCDIDGDPGVVICADSQESIGEYRVTVNKIKPRPCNNYDLVIGGAGSIAPLIDGLANTIERYVQGWEPGLSEEKARGKLEHKVGRYYRGQVNSYPAELVHKELDFIICIRDRISKAIYLWRATGTAVEPIEYWDLIGWEEPLYKYEVERLYEKGHATKLSAITLGVHLLSMGKATTRNIDEPFQVIGIGKEQVWVETPAFVDSLAHKVDRVNSALSKLMISTSKLSVSDQAFDKGLKRFEEEILGLRREAHTLQIHSAHHGHIASNVDWSVEPVFVPESPLQNPKPKEGKKTSKRKNPLKS